MPLRKNDKLILKSTTDIGTVLGKMYLDLKKLRTESIVWFDGSRIPIKDILPAVEQYMDENPEKVI